MTRLLENAKRWWLTALVSVPLLAQTDGCLDASTSNDLRQGLADAATSVLTAASSYIVNDLVNRLLDIPTSSFSSFGF